MKIQPIDFNNFDELSRAEAAAKPVAKSRLRRLFEFPSFLNKGNGVVFEEVVVKDEEVVEPSSVALAKMVQNFLEGVNDKEKQPALIRHGSTDSSDEDFETVNCFGGSNHFSSRDACEFLKSLVVCQSVHERNLLADASKIVDKNKIWKRKDGDSRKVVVDGLIALGYDASICKSRWEKNARFPPGEYEYIDVIIADERFIVDVDFRSEFEIARYTKSYKNILQTLPVIFVGGINRLEKIVLVVSEAAKHSLKKKGMPLPPWRRADYVKSKWLSLYTRMADEETIDQGDTNPESEKDGFVLVSEKEVKDANGWQPLMLKPKGRKAGVKVVSGLASVMEGRP